MYTAVGLTGINLELLHALGLHLKAHGHPYIIGGDFNVPPHELLALGWARIMGGAVLAPHSGTCRVRSGWSVLDYFVIGARLKNLVLSIEVKESILTPHRPVYLALDSKVRTSKFITMKGTKQLPIDPPMGPRPPPPEQWQSFEIPLSDPEGLQSVPSDDQFAVLTQQASDALEAWFGLAEPELMATLGADQDEYGVGRGREPRFTQTTSHQTYLNSGSG